MQILLADYQYDTNTVHCILFNLYFYQVGQLFDDSGNVPWAALDLLDEACDDKMNLEAVVCALGILKLRNYKNLKVFSPP